VSGQDILNKALLSLTLDYHQHRLHGRAPSMFISQRSPRA
jgi:hypothetical protein